MEALRHRICGSYPDILGQKTVHRQRQAARLNGLWLKIAHAIPQRVHARVCARAALYGRPRAVQPLQRVLQHLAHRERVFLHLKPVVSRAHKAQCDQYVHGAFHLLHPSSADPLKKQIADPDGREYQHRHGGDYKIGAVQMQLL